MNSKQWLDRATTFQLGKHPVNQSAVEIIRYEQEDGSFKYGVIMMAYALSRDLEWEYQSMPSGRTDDFLVNCRFKTRNEAYAIYLKEVKMSIRQRKLDIAKLDLLK